MERRKWDSAKKFEVVVEGLKSGVSISEMCNRHQISQAQYYKWRDQFINNGRKVFEMPAKNKGRSG
ncbi:MAG: transposase [Elusimicrobiota bacterium]